MAALNKTHYEPILKEDLACWRCDQGMKNMPILKAHLKDEWEKEAKREKAKLGKKREQEQQPTKKRKTDKDTSCADV
jgi:aprataxin